MQTDQVELRRQLAATAAGAGPLRFTARDVAVRAARIRQRRGRIAAAVSVAAAAVAAVVIPLTFGTSGPGNGQGPPSAVIAPASPAQSEAPPQGWTATINGHVLEALGTLPNQSANVPLFTVTRGEKLTIVVTITVPAHSTMTKLFLGITGDSAGIGPRGPIGMSPVLATAARLAPGEHKFTLHWTVPRASAPDGYQLALAEYWPRGTPNEPQAEELPMVRLG